VSDFDLIETSKKLLENSPTQSDCSRAVSTAYYALFRGLCGIATESLVDNENFERANYQVFRSLDHKNVVDRCKDTRDNKRSFPLEIKQFADTLVELNEQRENADYCPKCKFTSLEASNLIEQAEAALVGLSGMDEQHMRAFALYVLLKPNKRNQLRRSITNKPT